MCAIIPRGRHCTQHPSEARERERVYLAILAKRPASATTTGTVIVIRCFPTPRLSLVRKITHAFVHYGQPYKLWKLGNRHFKGRSQRGSCASFQIKLIVEPSQDSEPPPELRREPARPAAVAAQPAPSLSDAGRHPRSAQPPTYHEAAKSPVRWEGLATCAHRRAHLS